MILINYSSYAAFAIIGFASVFYHYTTRKGKKLTQKTRKKQIHDVLMFSEIPQSELMPSKFSKFRIHPSMDKLMSYMILARHSLDVCMYMITNCDIAHTIQKLHSRGVKIRFIVDADMAYATGSATKRIEKHGIELRWMKSTHLMHHKFCIIDASHNVQDSMSTPFVMIGSLNWTTQAFKGNWENVLVTSKPAIVGGLKDEFEKLWVKFKPLDAL